MTVRTLYDLSANSVILHQIDYNAEHNLPETCKSIIDRNALILEADKYFQTHGTSSLIAAIYNKRIELIEYLFEIMNEEQKKEAITLHQSRYGMKSAIDLCLESGLENAVYAVWDNIDQGQKETILISHLGDSPFFNRPQPKHCELLVRLIDNLTQQQREQVYRHRYGIAENKKFGAREFIKKHFIVFNGNNNNGVRNGVHITHFIKSPEIVETFLKHLPHDQKTLALVATEGLSRDQKPAFLCLVENNLRCNSQYITRLLEGLDPLEKSRIIRSRDNYGLTALHETAFKGYVSVAETLLENLPEAERIHAINDNDISGHSPLDYAVIKKDLRMLKLFAQYDINIFYNKGVIKNLCIKIALPIIGYLGAVSACYAIYSYNNLPT